MYNGDQMITEKLQIDKRDVEILNLYMQNPKYSQSEIAALMKLSQPSVNARIAKLQKKGILSFNSGINFNATNLVLVRVDFSAKNPKELVDRIKNCSFFVNAFFVSGKQNVSLFLACEELRKVEEIVNKHLRTNSDVSDITMTIMTSSVKHFLINLDLTREVNSKHCYTIGGCDDCTNVKGYKTVGKVSPISPIENIE
jgi:Lrp/AsnC family transcriptional regulator, leucine-responsive regulatory protein